MSSDYYIVCDKCKLGKWIFSRQAWGTGNADIIDSFRFMMLHTIYKGCGNHLRIIEWSEWFDTCYGENKTPEEDIKIMNNFFPGSGEWEDMSEYLKDREDRNISYNDWYYKKYKESEDE